MKKPMITKSVRKNAAVFTVVLFIGYLIFNFFSVLEINYYFVDHIDVRLRHEVEHIFSNIVINDETVVVLQGKEFEETDMVNVSDNSYFLQVFNLKGDVIFQSKNLRLFKGMPTIIYEFDDEYFFKDETVNFRGLRVCYAKIIGDGKLYGYVQLGTPKTAVNKAIEDVISFNLLTLPLAFILFVIVSLIFAKRSLNPINKIITIAEEISATNLSKRIDYEADAEDELGRLKATLNNLFDRLEFQINQISQFSDNASHQLMTPLTAINTELEYILRKEHSEDEYKETLENIDEQTSEMINIVKTLLILARDCDVCTDSHKVFSLTNLFNQEIKEAFKNDHVTINVSENIYLKGEGDYFKMVLENLIGNAIKYSSENDEVKIEVKIGTENIRILIFDKGIGISDSEKQKVFERFYRGDNVESSGIKGHGLGLNLVKTVVNKMGGNILIEDNEPKGTIFIIEIPKLILE